jgi:hypothetical protein
VRCAARSVTLAGRGITFPPPVPRPQAAAAPSAIKNSAPSAGPPPPPRAAPRSGAAPRAEAAPGAAGAPKVKNYANEANDGIERSGVLQSLFR